MAKLDKGLKPGAQIPAFSLTSTDGHTYTAQQLLGRPFLLYFLRGTW